MKTKWIVTIEMGDRFKTRCLNCPLKTEIDTCPLQNENDIEEVMEGDFQSWDTLLNGCPLEEVQND